MLKVRLAPMAQKDMLDLWRWVARDDPRTADRIFDDFDALCSRIARFPQMGRPRPELATEARSIVLKRWLVVYRVGVGEVAIMRVVPTARDLTKLRFPSA